MKKISFFVISGMTSLLFSCNTGTTPATKTSDSTASVTSNQKNGESTQAEKNRANTLAVYKGIEMGDLSAMDNFVADSCIDHSGEKGEIVGRENIKKALADIHNHISNLKMDMFAEATSGDYHFALTRITGTTKDATMGMPANTPVDQTHIDLVKVVNGKATDHWSYVNPADMMKMMKMMPAKH